MQINVDNDTQNIVSLKKKKKTEEVGTLPNSFYGQYCPDSGNEVITRKEN